MDDAQWQAAQRRFFALLGIGSVLLIGGMAALVAWDRSRRAELDEFTFTVELPAFFVHDAKKARGYEIGKFMESPLYANSLALVPGSDRDLMPVGRLDNASILVYQSRAQENRLREDGTGQYFVPVAPGRFLEATDFPPAP